MYWNLGVAPKYSEIGIARTAPMIDILKVLMTIPAIEKASEAMIPGHPKNSCTICTSFVNLVHRLKSWKNLYLTLSSIIRNFLPRLRIILDHICYRKTPIQMDRG